ncbi:MAG: hypothetical protein JRN62_03595 [Nitrososphaerota archaeon]|jgi:hypothetical protein|nr:hypothetical protein [Nitrososphaerota archaeon]MDG6948685.1 hypothetical protein [Nitrososphaerota archaeon]
MAEKSHVVVIVWQGCIDSVKLCTVLEDAKAFFKSKVGIDYDEASAHMGDSLYEQAEWLGSDIFTLEPDQAASGNAPGRC